MKGDIATSLIVLYEMEHIDIILAYFGSEKLKSGDDYIIIPIDYGIELALRERGIPFHSMTGYVARSSLKERALLVSRMMKQLYVDHEFSFFTHKGIPLGKIVGYSLGEYLLRILHYLDIFECILDQCKNIGKVYLPEPTVKLSATVGQLAEFEIRAGIDTMTFVTQKRGVIFQTIPCPSTVAAEKKLHNFVRSRIRHVVIWSVKLLNSFISLFRARGALKVFASDYWWHIDSFITKMEGVEITMMERKEIQSTKNFVWKHKIRFNHPSDYSTYAIKRRAMGKRRYYERMWREISAHPDFSGQCIWHGIHFWELVRPAYSYLVTSFSAEVVEMLEATERLFKKQKIQAVILRASASGQIHFATLGLVAHSMGIPAIELQHGLECYKEFSLSVHKNADIIASYGPLIKKELENVNGVDMRVLNIGSPRFDQYRNEKVGEEAKCKLLEKMNLDARHTILLYVATDIVLGQTHDTYSMLRLFKNIAAVTDSIDGLQIIMKIRPGPATENFFKQSLKEVFGLRCHIAQYENLHELISISSVVASSFSTVALETMIAEKPIILVGLDENDRMLMESHFLPYEQAQALCIARTQEEFIQQVRAIIKDPDEAKTLVRNANTFLEDNFCFDGRSTERMIDLLETMRK